MSAADFGPRSARGAPAPAGDRPDRPARRGLVRARSPAVRRAIAARSHRAGSARAHPATRHARWSCTVTAGEAERGKQAFEQLGYSRVALLQGGLSAWKAAGFELFEDVNSYSKAFGELVEARRHTPSLSAEEVGALIAQQADIAIVDARRFEEYQTMSIPTGTSVPGAELVLRVPSARARSAHHRDRQLRRTHPQHHRRAVADQCRAAEPGRRARATARSAGNWQVRRSTRDSSAARRSPRPRPSWRRAARRARSPIAAACATSGEPNLRVCSEDATRTAYQFDVRTPEEYAAGHLPGFRSAPGGQLVQETDFFAPVRGARIVLTDDLGARADMTASWLAQMAWDVYVVAVDAGQEHRRRPRPTSARRRARARAATSAPTRAPTRRRRDARLPGVGVRAGRTAGARRHTRILRRLTSHGRHDHGRQIHRLHRLQQQLRDPPGLRASD